MRASCTSFAIFGVQEASQAFWRVRPLAKDETCAVSEKSSWRICSAQRTKAGSPVNDAMRARQRDRSNSGKRAESGADRRFPNRERIESLQRVLGSALISPSRKAHVSEELLPAAERAEKRPAGELVLPSPSRQTSAPSAPRVSAQACASAGEQLLRRLRRRGAAAMFIAATGTRAAGRLA